MRLTWQSSQAIDLHQRLAFLIGLLLALVLLTACSVQTQVETASTSPAQDNSTSRANPETMQPDLTQTPAKDAPSSSETQPQSQTAVIQPTSAVPVCSSPAILTPALTEGPYFKAGSPERSTLVEPGMPGIQLNLTGYVLTADCQPVAHALLDFWQADANGNYDNAGYTLRGHQFTDEKGFYQLTTVVPGLYPGRTEHIHFKVQAPGGSILTSQLFFPDVPNNESDQIFDPALVINILQESSTQVDAAYNFIITH
jgi:protocatechuate 3,4-dioxygenase beta subunit